MCQLPCARLVQLTVPRAADPSTSSAWGGRPTQTGTQGWDLSEGQGRQYARATPRRRGATGARAIRKDGKVVHAKRAHSPRRTGSCNQPNGQGDRHTAKRTYPNRGPQHETQQVKAVTPRSQG